MPSYIIKPFKNHFYHSLLLAWNELKRNTPAWLAPLPILLGVVYWSSRFKWEPIGLNQIGTWLYLLISIILIMVYGLQSFSTEADRKTLDFILAKPISPYSIMLAKYLPGLIIFWSWYYVFSIFLKTDLALLNLPKGIGVEWLVLVLLTVHAVSFFSGLLARGLERFFVVTVITLLIGSGAYYLWQKIFTLIEINYLWFDIPPQLLFFLEKLLPYFLTILSLLAPLTGVIWSLKSKIQIWRFKPALGLLGIWLFTFLLIQLACFIFNPPVWPDQYVMYGDWDSKNGIVFAGLNKGATNTKKMTTQSYLSINKLSQKPHKIYIGTNINSPRFAPDGNRIVFSENGRVKIFEIKNKAVSDIGEGHIAAWNDDGNRLIVGKKIGPKGLSQLYLIDLANNQTRQLTPKPIDISELIWDSKQGRLYIWGFTDNLYCMDLKDTTIKELQFPEKTKPMFFGIVKPNIRFQKEDRLIFIGQVFNRTVTIYILNMENNSIWLSEEKSDFRILTNGPLVFNQEGTAYLWPRIDGGFVYQSTYYDRNHHHDHSHEHNHEHNDGEQ